MVGASVSHLVMAGNGVGNGNGDGDDDDNDCDDHNDHTVSNTSCNF